MITGKQRGLKNPKYHRKISQTSKSRQPINQSVYLAWSTGRVSCEDELVSSGKPSSLSGALKVEKWKILFQICNVWAHLYPKRKIYPDQMKIFRTLDTV